MNDNQQITAPGVKIITAWTAVGITSWSDAAAALAALYTLLLILEWMWKKMLRPFLESRGLMIRPKRRKDDPTA